MVTSLARPGGNLTGFSLMGGELRPKRLELLSELAPQAKVAALLVNPNMPGTELFIADIQAAACVTGLQLAILRAGAEEEFETAFASLGQLHAGALLVAADVFFSTRRNQLVALAARHAVPAIYFGRVYAVCRGWRPDQLCTEHHG